MRPLGEVRLFLPGFRRFAKHEQPFLREAKLITKFLRQLGVKLPAGKL